MSQQEAFQVYLGLFQHLLSDICLGHLWPKTRGPVLPPPTHTSCDLNASVTCGPPSSTTQEPLAIPTQDLKVAGVSASSRELTLDRCLAAQIVLTTGLALFPACTAAGMAGTPSLWPYRLVTQQITKWYRLRVGTGTSEQMLDDPRGPGWGWGLAQGILGFQAGGFGGCFPAGGSPNSSWDFPMA